MKKQRFLLILLASILTPAAAHAATARDYLIRFSNFLEDVLLPTIFSIAFLFFIYNTARYFIIDATNQVDRTKAKNQALYSVAAFVFLISIWAIVSMVANGLGVTNEDAICPDYYENFNGTCQPAGASGYVQNPSFPSGGGSTGSYTGGSGAYTGGSGTYTGGASSGGGATTGGGTTGGGTTDSSGSATGSGTNAPLAELIFGTGKDGAGFHRSLLESAALASTPTIATVSSCEDGFATLQLSARTETTQAAYLYYTTSAGQKRWKNITDRTSANYIGYDRDVLDDLLTAGATDLVIVHTHPDNRIDAIGLTATGHGPSAADMQLMCQLNDPTITYVTVDETGLWSMNQAADTCPYIPQALSILPSIETYGDLSVLEASTRSSELAAYLSDSLTPAAQKTELGSINRDSLASLTTEEVQGLGAAVEARASTTVMYYQNIADFCLSR